jgi:AmiR/NasT family two-component response regulator
VTVDLPYKGAPARQPEVRTLREASRLHGTVGQAVGMLMERHDLTAERAFSTLVRVSEHQNRNLEDVAAQLVSEAGQR